MYDSQALLSEQLYSIPPDLFDWKRRTSHLVYASFKQNKLHYRLKVCWYLKWSLLVMTWEGTFLIKCNLRLKWESVFFKYLSDKTENSMMILRLILPNAVFCQSLVNKRLEPIFYHFAVKVIDFAFLCFSCTSKWWITQNRKKEKCNLCGWNLMCHIKRLQPKINKPTQYLEDCFCYCHSGHWSNPFSKLQWCVSAVVI